ncbi:beta-1,4-mannosyl-glycoprotein 4-beta-N-acetylglucosaminyltransferase [Eurytemora carolleeae]|uniref:beta-1,4-mannosyl-glycoprotein 4-beta-N-acetylglucosaminyltransferase n=1 Tax=Eurytemora carolleeae TaxID=1294199 RepID=UPI000C790FFF|nr:beta-1,4-mannosyl-glycoprotein 4-beta-N-acetylglucosaminyltransferase [Eurytemora carolleeae]|eukprot:XP_023341090.1 beta-1,4-mannosyl-glycoprotein 4-beta-N-acetylglucosaminyltransferase-like [Eurytemora affinis]
MKMIENTREDDIFLLLDADELPTKEALIFLKLFDGWREPVKFGFRWTVFGFFWLKAEDPGQLESIPLIGKLFSRKKQERLLTLYTVCTLGMLSTVYGDNAMLLRRNVWNNTLLHDRLNNYTANHPKIQEWTLGNIGHYAGHHCSWCYSPEGIRLKLEAAQRHDKPRWGDYPDKLNLKYIQELIRTGGWFDGSKPFISVPRTKNDTGLFAPDYILNSNLFQYLVKPPS